MLVTAGIIDWSPHLPQLYTAMLAAFNVPVGTAGASVPTAQGATHQAAILFGSKVDHVDDAPKSAAKLAVHLLKQPDSSGSSPAAASAAAAVATAVRTSSNELAAAAGGGGGGSGLERMMSAGFGATALGSGVVTPGILSHTTSSSGGGGGANATTSGSSSRKGRGRSSAAAAADGGNSGPATADQPMTAAVATACDDLDSLVQLLEQYCHPSNGGNWSHGLAAFLSQGVHYFMKQMGRQCGTRGWKGEQRIVPEAARRYVRAAMRLAARGQFSKSQSEGAWVNWICCCAKSSACLSRTTCLPCNLSARGGARGSWYIGSFPEWIMDASSVVYAFTFHAICMHATHLSSTFS